jgi:hypothetical protein
MIAPTELPQTKLIQAVLAINASDISSGTGTPVCGIPFRGAVQEACRANAVSFVGPFAPITKVDDVLKSIFHD